MNSVRFFAGSRFVRDNRHDEIAAPVTAVAPPDWLARASQKSTGFDWTTLKTHHSVREFEREKADEAVACKIESKCYSWSEALPVIKTSVRMFAERARLKPYRLTSIAYVCIELNKVAESSRARLRSGMVLRKAMPSGRYINLSFFIEKRGVLLRPSVSLLIPELREALVQKI